MRVWIAHITVWIVCVAGQVGAAFIAAVILLALGALGVLGPLLVISVAYFLVGILAFWLAFSGSGHRWNIAATWSAGTTAAATLAYFTFEASNSVLIVDGIPMDESGNIFYAFVPFAIENAVYCFFIIAVVIWAPLRIGELFVNRYAKTERGDRRRQN
jgi:hypothetical protein